MKSAYELAMERLEKDAPQEKITDTQREEIAAIDDKFKAKIAERELFLTDLIAKAKMEGDFGGLQDLEKQKAHDISSLKSECERAKEAVRSD